MSTKSSKIGLPNVAKLKAFPLIVTVEIVCPATGLRVYVAGGTFVKLAISPSPTVAMSWPPALNACAVHCGA